LRKIGQRSGEVGTGLDLSLAKAKYWQGAPSSVEVVEEDEAGPWLREDEYAVLGATAFTCLKKRRELKTFDLVVVDEASQVRVPEAAIAASLVAPSGRLVLAGDHCQLPPIIAGSYPEPKEGEPPLHRSIFEAVARRAAEGHGRETVPQPRAVARRGAEGPGRATVPPP